MNRKVITKKCFRELMSFKFKLYSQEICFSWLLINASQQLLQTQYRNLIENEILNKQLASINLSFVVYFPDRADDKEVMNFVLYCNEYAMSKVRFPGLVNKCLIYQYIQIIFEVLILFVINGYGIYFFFRWQRQAY